MLFRIVKTYWTQEESDRGTSWQFKIVYIQTDAERTQKPMTLTLTSPTKLQIAIGDLYSMEKRTFQKRL